MANEHFVLPPNWEWYILLYFFFAGLAGGAFVIGTMLRLWGTAADWVASRIAFLISLPLLLICPILLTLDLGKPLDFWHMLFNAGTGAPVLKTWSPMSLGAWALLIFGFFSFVMFLVALGEGDYLRSRALSRVGRLLIEWRPRWTRQVSPVLASVLVLVGVLALRAVIIFSAQA